MVDKAKRNTLKNIAGIGVGTIAISTSTAALADFNSAPMNAGTAPSLHTDLVDIQVSTRVSPQANELEVVLTNVGTVPANITNMTPAVINTTRGRFDFDALFKEGTVQLAVGETVSVPMQHHVVVLDNTTIGKRSVLLNDALRQNISIVTDSNSFAAVDFVRPIA